MTNHRRGVATNFVLSSAYQILQVLTPLVTAPYVARVLGAEAIGKFSYSQSVANYFVMLGTLGISTYGVRLVARCGDDRGLRSVMFWEAYISQVFVALAALGLYSIYIVGLPSDDRFVAVGWTLWVAGVVLDVSWLFFGVEEFGLPTLRNALVKLGSILGIFLFVRSADDLWLYVVIMAGAQFTTQIWLWPFVGRYVDWKTPKWNRALRHLLSSVRLFLPVVAISLYTTLDKIILAHLSDMAQVGYFEYSEKFSRMPLLLVTALTTVMLPRVSNEMKLGMQEAVLERLRTSAWWMLSVSFGLAFGLGAVSPEFVSVMFGDEFHRCVPLMRVLVCIIPVVALTNVIGRQFLLPALRDKEYTSSLVMGAIVNVAVIVALAGKVGALGAALATLLAEITIFVYQGWRCRNDLPVVQYLWAARPFMIAGSIMFMGVRLVGFIGCRVSLADWVLLFLEIVIGGVLYLAVGLCLSLRTDSHFATAVWQSAVSRVGGAKER
ncbi:oligosaccharide flippase family protein [Actinomyces weissii]|uniref:Oligosaccharide flippase family protein n=1 Tax=Actinomyces weissii TaxID=675090 RepID=A0A7T7S2E3_9ACTO|nr:oligosaccharide flippase family protein [Actinomyces weissii]QQM67936.1 oligosaccharide flippase family protein [Actinomyces weissii]